MTARLEPLPADAVVPILGKLTPITLFRVLGHNPRVLSRVVAGGLLDRGSISLREREIVILRTTARLGSEYEWGVHVQFFAAKAGFTAGEIAATAAGRIDAWSPAERLLLRLVDALVDRHDVDDTLWSEIAEQWTPPQLLEIVVLVGLYHMISFATAAFRVPLEAEAPRFAEAAALAADPRPAGAAGAGAAVPLAAGAGDAADAAAPGRGPRHRL